MSRHWQRAILEAAAKIDARSEDEFRADVATALRSVAGETFRDGAALYGRLYRMEKERNGGNALGLSAMHRLRHIVAALWPILDAAQRGEPLTDTSTSQPFALQESV